MSLKPAGRPSIQHVFSHEHVEDLASLGVTADDYEADRWDLNVLKVTCDAQRVGSGTET